MAWPSDKAGSSSGTSKRKAENDQEAGLVPPLKKRRTVAAKRVAKKSLTAEDVRPTVITFEEGEDPKDLVLVSNFLTDMSAQYNIGGLQVVGKEIEADKMTIEVMQQELPTIKVVIELDDGEEPPVT